MMPQVSATPAPIHDIVDFVEVFPIPLWMILSLAGIGVLLLGFLVWLLFFRPKKPVILTAKQKALLALTELRGEGADGEPYAFAVRISDVLRRYAEEAFGVRAVTATSMEFLESLRAHPHFSEEERDSLKEFLETSDLIKFAHVQAGEDELEKLLQAAAAFVNKEAVVEEAR